METQFAFDIEWWWKKFFQRTKRWWQIGAILWRLKREQAVKPKNKFFFTFSKKPVVLVCTVRECTCSTRTARRQIGIVSFTAVRRRHRRFHAPSVAYAGKVYSRSRFAFMRMHVRIVYEIVSARERENEKSTTTRSPTFSSKLRTMVRCFAVITVRVLHKRSICWCMRTCRSTASEQMKSI